MKMNQWTLALAALGLVSLTAAQAEDATPKLVPVETALSSTTISGYVDTSAEWDLGTQGGSTGKHVAPFAFNAGKSDGFNLDLVDVNISKAVDPAVPWSAGYTVDLLFGPDAASVDGSSAEYLRQAYVTLSAPIGTVPTLKLGRFDQLLGSESVDAYKNYNWTRSYGFSIEPTEETGALLEYRVADWLLLDGGVVDQATTGPINARSTRAESRKAYTGLVTVTAPKSFGFLADSSIAAGITHGPGTSSQDKTHVFAGGNFNTPLKGLKLGVGYDAVFHMDGPAYVEDTTTKTYSFDGSTTDLGYATTIAGYASYDWTDKFNTSARVDYGRGQYFGYANADADQIGLEKLMSLTGTLTYKLWGDSVITRLEARLDHAYGQSRPFGGTDADGNVPTKKNSLLIAANVVYKF